MKQIFIETINYVYTGLFPNILAINEVPRIVEEFHSGRVPWIGITIFGLNALVGLHKYGEYTGVKRLLETYGWDERIVKPKMYSWCQRHAAKQAARRTGYLEEYLEFEKREGHRIYHLLPKIHRFREITAPYKPNYS